MAPKQSIRLFARATVVALALVTLAVSAYGGNSNPPPVITEASASVDTSAHPHVLTLALTGTNLKGELGYGVYSVTLGGTLATSVTSNTATAITATFTPASPWTLGRRRHLPEMTVTIHIS